MLKVVLTGGPCAGKSTALSTLVQKLEERGYKVITVIEAATKLILSGIVPGKNISLLDFQMLVFEEQLNNEDIAIKAAKYFNDYKDVVIICDRGIADQMAYISKKEFENMIATKGMTISDIYGRYDCVLSLVTAADGAEEFYEWANPNGPKGKNLARSESPEEAREKDKLTQTAWVGSSHLRVIDNSTDFNQKIQRVVEEIFNALGEPVPSEIERKFLIKMPTQEEIESLGAVSSSNIIQTYLIEKEEGVERRVRQRGTAEDGFNFYYTEKKPIGYGERAEKERKISVEEYISLLAEADTSLHQISKTRHCFLYDQKYYELDIYPFSTEYAILEIELNDINEELNLPTLSIIRDVTDDKKYKNSTLAKTLLLSE